LHTSSSTPPTAPGFEINLLQGRFSGPREFSELVRQALLAASAQGWRELLICDTDFKDWPLGERAVVESLNAWAGAGRKFTMLAANYDEVFRRHARFVTWRKTWSHLVECRRCSAAHRENLPSALWSPVWVFHRVEASRSVGFASTDVRQRSALREQLAEHLLQSHLGFPATTLGL
jgi:hypothetical protein